MFNPITQEMIDADVANKKLNAARWLRCIKKHEIMIEEAKQCVD